jgi:DNA-binding NarL/FixJ family response regulator
LVDLGGRAVEARVLVLTTYDTDSDVLPAIQAGATGYLLKDTPREELFRAVRARLTSPHRAPASPRPTGRPPYPVRPGRMERCAPPA